MAVEADTIGHDARTDHGVSGVVTCALFALVHSASGDRGVAQVLALADDNRTFAALVDRSTWSSVAELSALFDASAVVTGDNAIGLSVGEAILDGPGRDEWADRLGALDGPAAVLKHVGPLIEHIEQASEAIALAVAGDHALVEVAPLTEPWRNAHLCEMTRGLLSRVPVLFGLEPARVLEPECSARGGRRCLYALRWTLPNDRALPDDRTLFDDRAGSVPDPGPSESRSQAKSRLELEGEVEIAGTETSRPRSVDLSPASTPTGVAEAPALRSLEPLGQASHTESHDAITGLPDRRLFEDRAGHELSRSHRTGQPMCVFLVDLDRFDVVNNSLGRDFGYEMLRQVGSRLIDAVRRGDTVARVGGGQFAVLLPGMGDQAAVDQLADRTREDLARPYHLFGEQVDASASIGTAIAPVDGHSYDTLMNRAVEAMYAPDGATPRVGTMPRVGPMSRADAMSRADETSRVDERVEERERSASELFEGPPTGASAPEDGRDEGSLAGDLVDALERDELFVLYQPYVDPRTAQMCGVEALVRWQHPALGMLEPDSFVPLAERSDIIVAIDTWVLEEGCRQLREWLDQGLSPLRLSVNLGSRDLAHPHLLQTVERCLVEHDLAPSLLELEITERVAVNQGADARRAIDQLRRLGVRFTIDDFGKGNSSLDRIGSFPINTLKIDRSFVQVLGPDGESDALVSAIISMANRLGLDCVAEGVETPQQNRILLQRGCTLAQGFYFSPPLEPDDITGMLAAMAAVEGTDQSLR